MIRHLAQHRLIRSLRKLEEVQQAAWYQVIRATNDLAHAVEEGQDMSPDLMLEIEKLMDAPALQTAWMYSRLEHAMESRRGTADKLRNILGYGK